jgi:hypothetical protein
MKRQIHPVSTEVQLLADQLRAAQAASLADPNTPPWRRRMLEALKRADEARQREEAQQSAAGVTRHASKAGVDVARYDVRPDCTISIVSLERVVLLDLAQIATGQHHHNDHGGQRNVVVRLGQARRQSSWSLATCR